MAYTKGRWKVWENGSPAKYSVGVADYPIARICGPNTELMQHEDSITQSQSKSNAILISMAPELLIALEWSLEAVGMACSAAPNKERGEYYHEMAEEFRALIRKAKGE